MTGSRETAARIAYKLVIVVALENKKLFRERMESERFKREMELAQEVQNMLIPLRLHKEPGVEIGAKYFPHQNIGGDYFDFIRVSDDEFLWCIADVSGKGIPSSLIMASFRASLLAEIRNNYSIRTIMAKVNQLLWESTDAHQFVTAFYAVLDEKRRVLTYCNAGHNPVLLIHSDGSYMKLETGGLN